MEVNSKLSDKAQYDLILIERAKDNDQGAFKELYDKYYGPIYYLVLKMVGNPSDAEDLTSEALGKAFRNIHQYVPTYAFSSWLFKIATNKSIDFIRKRRMNLVGYELIPQNQSDLSEGGLASLSLEKDPENLMIQLQTREHLWELVDSLKPHYRLLVIMRYFEEFTYEEISVALDLPMGTVKAQLFRSRVMLQELLKGKDALD
ncbi:MAG: RNA polymerase subunit sigma-24 [Bacteroidetes bacterium]|nr:MAG: RNA polymerase subunit sigma-24 [Bacteroidota bacterium]